MLKTNALQLDCRFCSLVSKASGQEPIGSAGTFHQWLICEIPQPWPTTIWQDNPLVAAVLEMVKTLRQQGVYVRPLMIAPDREYSHPDYTRILYYRRPHPCFADFEKQEFILPTHQVVPLATALLQQPETLPEFEHYRRDTHPVRELFVCTHGNVDVACARFGYPLYQQLRQDSAGPFSGSTVRVLSYALSFLAEQQRGDRSKRKLLERVSCGDSTRSSTLTLLGRTGVPTPPSHLQYRLPLSRQTHV